MQLDIDEILRIAAITNDFELPENTPKYSMSTNAVGYVFDLLHDAGYGMNSEFAAKSALISKIGTDLAMTFDHRDGEFLDQLLAQDFDLFIDAITEAHRLLPEKPLSSSAN